MADINLKVSFDAMVVRQLGEELITDPEQAILELVKNSYDADSKSCSIVINSASTDGGLISISDKGHGMSRGDIQKGWLTISYSEKRSFKKHKQRTDKFNRPYQGDKGLGRLSAMKLGHVVRINTKKEGCPPVCVEIDWRNFSEGTDVGEVVVKEIPTNRANVGTTIEISEIFDEERWNGIKAAQRIKAKLSSLISPFNFESDFKVYLDMNGVSYDLDTLTSDIKAFSISHFEYKFNGEKLFAKGRMKFSSFLRSQEDRSDDKSAYYQSWLKFFKSDSGKQFFNQLSEKKGILSAYEISLCEDEGTKNGSEEPWYLEFKIEYLWKELAASSNVLVRKPGNFTAEWYQILRQGLAITKKELTSRRMTAETKEVMNNLVGIGVYKSGFRVGNNSYSDWLGLSKEATSGRGFYSLRPENVIGYIKFENYEGESLRETSDRQGFVEDETFHGFIRLTDTMKSFANDFINLARKEFSKFIRKSERDEIDDGNRSQNKTSEDDFRKAVNQLNSLKDSSKQARSSLSDDVRKTKSLVDQLDIEARKSSEYDKYANFIENIKRDLEEHLREIEAKNTLLTKVLTSADRVVEELEEYSDRLDQFYESASVGLSAEYLAHDINPFLDEIQSEARKVKNLDIDDRKKKTLLVRSSNVISDLASLLAREISIINPMLRTKRRVLSNFSLKEGTDDFFDLKRPMLAKRDISVKITHSGDSEKIKFSKGQFYQVLDNLIRNSQHWLNVFSKQEGKAAELSINVEISRGLLKISDSGYGISDRVAPGIFEMFFTTRESGHGLGLFIVDNIMSHQGCSVSLLDDRNQFGNRYIFLLNFTPAMVEE